MAIIDGKSHVTNVSPKSPPHRMPRMTLGNMGANDAQGAARRS
jgi:hypothetical protein